jgi:hypothetical protein
MADAVDLGAENDERMAQLREALALGEGFQLVIVQVEPGEQREEVLRRLAGWSGAAVCRPWSWCASRRGNRR